jgi:acyl carrier protein
MSSEPAPTPATAPGTCPACSAPVAVEPASLTGETSCPACRQPLAYVNLRPQPHWYRAERLPEERRKKVERALAVIHERLGLAAPGTAVDDASFQDLGADSLDLVEVVMELEEVSGVTIPDEDADKLRTIGAVVDYLVEKMKE